MAYLTQEILQIERRLDSDFDEEADNAAMAKLHVEGSEDSGSEDGSQEESRLEISSFEMPSDEVDNIYMSSYDSAWLPKPRPAKLIDTKNDEE